MKAKLRHLAMIVDDLQKTVTFYEQTFGMRRVRETASAVALTDGYMDLSIIHSSNIHVQGETHRGLHHMGFLIDDMENAASCVESNGAVYHGTVLDTRSGPKTERKYRDPNGLMFDIVTDDYAQRVWRLGPDVSTAGRVTEQPGEAAVSNRPLQKS